MEHQLNYWISHFGYWGIILALVGGIIGLPLPDEFLLTYVGYNIFTGNLVYGLALICACIGAFIGITVSYLLGIWLGAPFLQKYGSKIGIDHKKINSAHKLFEKFGPFILIIGYFIPGVRYISAYLAGISKLAYRKFAFYAYSGGFIWIFFFITIGRELGKKWTSIRDFSHHFGLIASLIIIILAIVSYFFMKKNKTFYEN
ncbi:DedA family protein [Cytobacillus sp. Hz8]|uniref:DedA family protein n=1 Tax=Cytobacillus sp. Hz8 TaxID=3347168 RepID=UPI0035D70F07